ncbi:MAG: flagellar biosynthesis anti-sigma factor FlgM [Clostridiales bacterium]|nr:flagellar biosynthesis anti-sigma factor FlgM [Clostridiales bacterium]
MKINRSGYTQMIQQMEQVKKAKTDSSSVEKKDSIEISKESMKINEYVKNSQTSNAERVEQIKNQLKEGTYKVSSEKLAEKILEKINDQTIEVE